VSNSNCAIHVLGLGPVGLATSWDLLNRGLSVFGVDTSRQQLNRILKNDLNIDLSLLSDISSFIEKKKFTLSESLADYSVQNHYYIVCVGTPTNVEGINLDSIKKAIHDIQSHNAVNKHIIIRSTLQPGILNALKPLFKDHTLFSYYPEFLREKDIKDDVLNPPLSIATHLNHISQTSFDKIFPKIESSIDQFTELEALKVLSNAFHALKVSYANEIFRLGEVFNFNSHFVMKAFVSDKKLNISELYLKPGEPFAGHCLEKDLKALETITRHHNLKLPVIASIIQSNDFHKAHLMQKK